MRVCIGVNSIDPCETDGAYDRQPKLSRVSIPVVGLVPDAILQSKLTV